MSSDRNAGCGFSLDLGPDVREMRDWVNEFAETVTRPAGSDWDEREETPWPILGQASKIGLYSLDFFAQCRSSYSFWRASHSSASIAKSSSVLHSPLKNSLQTRRASWRMPSRLANLTDGSLRSSIRATMRCRPSPAKPSRSITLAASVA